VVATEEPAKYNVIKIKEKITYNMVLYLHMLGKNGIDDYKTAVEFISDTNC
jgi:hypothetical protein